MKREEAIKVMNTIIAGVKHNIQLPMTVNDIEDACYMAIEALKERPITLESAIDYLTEIGWLKIHDKELTQERPHGKWIAESFWSEGVGMGERYGYYFKCSCCGNRVKGGYKECNINYCDNCGALMSAKGGDEK